MIYLELELLSLKQLYKSEGIMWNNSVKNETHTYNGSGGINYYFFQPIDSCQTLSILGEEKNIPQGVLNKKQIFVKNSPETQAYTLVPCSNMSLHEVGGFRKTYLSFWKHAELTVRRINLCSKTSVLRITSVWDAVRTQIRSREKKSDLISQHVKATWRGVREVNHGALQGLNKVAMVACSFILDEN